MTNLKKMNELVGASANVEQIKSWAYMNRICVCVLHEEDEFKIMEKQVDHFVESDLYSDDERENWSKFLDAEFIDNTHFDH